MAGLRLEPLNLIREVLGYLKWVTIHFMIIRADVPVSIDVTFLTRFIFLNVDVEKNGEADWTGGRK
jgi:hypothetical protein